MADQNRLTLGLLCAALLALAGSMVEVITFSGSALAGALGAAVSFLAAWGLSFMGARWQGAKRLRAIGVAFTVMGVAFADAWVMHAFVGPQPLEIILLRLIRNTLVAMSLNGIVMPALLTLPLMIAGSATADPSRSLAFIQTAYVLAGLMVLCVRAWPGNATPGRARPAVGMVVAMSIVMAAVLALRAGSAESLASRNGWLTSSGGTARTADYARDGIHDGQDTVDGSTNSQSSGTSDSDVFTESHRPSLYDVLTESFGEPVVPEDGKTMFLGSREVQFVKRHAEDSDEPGKQFSVHRKPPPADSAKRRDASALLFASGQGPRHLRMSVYTRFDGAVWHADEFSSLPVHAYPKRWFGEPPGDGNPEVPRDFSELSVVFGRLESRAIPTPAEVLRYRLGRVDLPGIFSWKDDCVLVLGRRSVPSSTKVEFFIRNEDSRQRAGIPLHSTERPPLRDWATRFAGSSPRGWAQIDAVITGVKEMGRLDRFADTQTLSVEAFLNQQSPGRDAHFATAAALMLQSLGYQTRLVQGFYVPPSRMDARTRLTPLHVDDAHTWLEVRATRGWVELEPTPGYELHAGLRDSDSTFRQIAAVCAAWLKQNGPYMGLLALTVTFLLWQRQRVTVLAQRLWFEIAYWEDQTKRAAQAIRIIEGRARIAGVQRPAHVALATWYSSLTADHADVRKALDLAERIHFRGDAGGQVVGPVMRKALAILTVSALKKAAPLPKHAEKDAKK